MEIRCAAIEAMAPTLTHHGVPHDGLARAIRPAHTMFDDDTVFALGTGLLDLDTLKQQAQRRASN